MRLVHRGLERVACVAPFTELPRGSTFTDTGHLAHSTASTSSPTAPSFSSKAMPSSPSSRARRPLPAIDPYPVFPGGALVLVEGDAIVAVESGTTPAPADCPVTALPGATLPPGLIDAHVH